MQPACREKNRPAGDARRAGRGLHRRETFPSDTPGPGMATAKLSEMVTRLGRREAPVGTLPEPSAALADPAEAADLAAVLDAEVAALPEALRLAVVLCELEGRPRKDAARELGIPEGTLSSRLAAARKALAARL